MSLVYNTGWGIPLPFFSTSALSGCRAEERGAIFKSPGGRATTGQASAPGTARQKTARRACWPLQRQLLGFDNVEELPRIIREAREHGTQIAPAEMLRHYFAEDAPIVRCHREIPSFVKLAIAHSRPARVNLSALNVAAHQQHAIRMAVIGATV